MSKQLQLSIPKPCHENWDNMSPVQQGKFCGSCQKQVVDFSNMSDRQVAEFFKKPTTGSVCGRFMTDQLDRSIEIPKKRIPWLKYFFQFVIPAFLVSIKASGQSTKGKIKVNTVTADTTTKPVLITLGMVGPKVVCTKPLMGDTVIMPVQAIKLSGALQLKVVDGKGEAIPYATVETGVIGKGGAANKNGLFSLDKSILNVNGNIFIASAGYERKEVPVKMISNLTGTFTVVLQNKGWLNEVVVVGISRQPARVTLGAVTRIDASQLTVKTAIKGKVEDENGKPLFGATVMIKGTQTGITTNADGSFSIMPLAGWNVATLVSSYVGFEINELLVDKKSYSDPVIIRLTPSRSMMVGELVITGKPVIKKELRRVALMPAVTEDKQNAAFKVFPNPVQSGSSLNIEIKKAEEGYYDLQLLDLSGQPVHRQEIWIDTEARLLNIDIPPVAAGNYFFVMINKRSAKKFTEKLIIE